MLSCGGQRQTSRSTRHPMGRTVVSEQSLRSFSGHRQPALLQSGTAFVSGPAATSWRIDHLPWRRMTFFFISLAPWNLPVQDQQKKGWPHWLVMLLGSLKARDTQDKLKPRAVLEKVLGHVGNTVQHLLCRHLFRFVLQASDRVLAVFLHPEPPAEVEIALQLCLIHMPESTFHGDTKDPESQGPKGCPFPQG